MRAIADTDLSDEKNTMKDRLSECRAGKLIHREMDLNALFQHSVRGQWQKITGQPYQASVLDVQLNMNKPDEAEKMDQGAPIIRSRHG